MEKFHERTRYSFLLVCLFFVIALMPIIEDYFDIRFLVSIALSLLAISAIYAVTGKKIIFSVGIILIIPVIIALWLSFIIKNNFTQAIYLAAHIIFLGFITLYIFLSTYKAKEVNRGVIHGAIVVYLLIGFSWSFIYALIECLHPGSFSHISDSSLFGHRPFVYFSFVTLTTLGLGDIGPTTPIARSLVILEAIIGQLYLIINVSWLVGLYVAHTRDERKP
ncbi:MAG: ion channel [Desulfobaccales bacterium]